jgi:phosphoserine phosphatase
MALINAQLYMPEAPIDIFFFDWDSTLTMIEGIDYLANLNGVAEHVQAITKRCMEKTGITKADYIKRLDLIKPHKDQIDQLALVYRTELSHGAREIIKLLQDMSKKIYILSGGIKSSIIPLANELGIESDCVHAVDIHFDNNGEYAGFDETSELINPYGKNRKIEKILKFNERSLLLGDGYSDWEARTAVTRFVGYAGVRPKQWVLKHSDFYINHNSLLSLLILSLTKNEQCTLVRKDKIYYQQGMSDFANGLVLIKEHADVYYPNAR